MPLRPVNDFIHVFPVLLVGLRRVIVHQRYLAVGIRRVQPVEFRERHRLDHGESFGCAVSEIVLRLLTIEPVEKLPGRISQVEKWRAILLHEKVTVRTHLELWRGRQPGNRPQHDPKEQERGDFHIVGLGRFSAALSSA